MNEYEALARALLSTPQGAKAIGNLDRISEMLNRPEGESCSGCLRETAGTR